MSYPLASLGEVCEINPRLNNRKGILPDTLVTFVPMAAVDEKAGVIAAGEVRRFVECAKGYTAFAEGDVLFAKITPCMENGKAAVARGLENGLGFGSTEFHVLRPTESILAEFVFAYIRQQPFRTLAKANFTGTAGQQRVPADFLKRVEIPLPSLDEQRQIVDMLADAAELRRLASTVISRADAFQSAIVTRLF